MATLTGRTAPGHWKIPNHQGALVCADVDHDMNLTIASPQCNDWKTHQELENRALAQLPEDRVWRTPMADGHAVYYLVSEKPLVLAHVPSGDGYQALPATIRGLTLEEVKRDIGFDIRSREIFRKHMAERESNPEPPPKPPLPTIRTIPVSIAQETNDREEDTRYSARLVQPHPNLDAVGYGKTPETAASQLRIKIGKALMEGTVWASKPLENYTQNLSISLNVQQHSNLHQP